MREGGGRPRESGAKAEGAEGGCRIGKVETQYVVVFRVVKLGQLPLLFKMLSIISLGSFLMSPKLNL